MKKFLLLVMGLMCIKPSFADDGSGMMMGLVTAEKMIPALMTSGERKNCGETSISFDGNQKKYDNEFLYETEDAYMSISGDSPDSAVLSGGRVYECDNEHCLSGKEQPMPANHYFKGKLVEEAKKYRCVLGLDNKWVPVFEGCQYDGKNISAGAWYTDGAGKRIELTHAQCLQVDDNMSLVDSGKRYNLRCEENHSLRCYSVEGDKIPVDPVKPVKPVNPVVGKCHPSVCTSEVCKACCAKPGTETIWTPSVNKCVCVNGGDFVKENNEWVCKTKTVVVTEPEKYICDAMLLANVVSWKNRCVNFADVLTQISALEAYCAAVPDKDVFLRLYDELKVVVDTTCVDEPEKDNTVVVIGFGTAQSKISESVSVLQTLTSDLDVKKWRDAQGKFNTARLASDSIAGVVLGTAGGLITSHVVKKNQIEDGFEDLNCSIGGQTVAGWSDEFNVGIQ